MFFLSFLSITAVPKNSSLSFWRRENDLPSFEIRNCYAGKIQELIAPFSYGQFHHQRVSVHEKYVIPSLKASLCLEVALYQKAALFDSSLDNPQGFRQ